MIVIGSQGRNHGHVGEFIIQFCKAKERVVKFLDPGHLFFDSGSESRHGLLRTLLNAKELVISNKTSSNLLLNIKILQGCPSFDWIILMLSDVELLCWGNAEHHLTSSLVLFDI